MILSQVNTLKRVGVAHLFLVPSIRTSCYTEMFSSNFPDLRNSTPGAIREPALPDLRNLVVVDNTGETGKWELRCAIDWREIMVWREDTCEGRLQKEISRSLHKDDVINLQFTRFVLMPTFESSP